MAAALVLVGFDAGTRRAEPSPGSRPPRPSRSPTTFCAEPVRRSRWPRLLLRATPGSSIKLTQAVGRRERGDRQKRPRGRVWSGGNIARPGGGAGNREERVLAERNRREALVGASERAAQAEHGARGALEGAAAALPRLDAESARRVVIAAHRAAVRDRG